MLHSVAIGLLLVVAPSAGAQQRPALTVAAAAQLREPAASVQQQRSTFTVGTATAERGQKVTGAILVPAGSDAGTDIAVAVIHGAKQGPVLALLSGSHGTEYASIIAMEKLIG